MKSTLRALIAVVTRRIQPLTQPRQVGFSVFPAPTFTQEGADTRGLLPRA